jgi:hypothetical protein
MDTVHVDKVNYWHYVAELFVEWEIFQANYVEKIKTHILCSIFFSRIWYRLWDKVAKYCRAGEPIDDNMTHTHCMLDN